MTDEKKVETKEYDIYRDSLLRYLGKFLVSCAIFQYQKFPKIMMQYY